MLYSKLIPFIKKFEGGFANDPEENDREPVETYIP